MGTLYRDLRIGVRHLLKSWRSTTVAILCLGLGIGISTAIFSVVNTILLRPLPLLADTDRLVMIYDAENVGSADMDLSRVTPFNYIHWKEQARAFEGMESLRLRSLHLTGQEEPLQLRGAAVTAGLFTFLGVEPIHGRGFLPEEDTPGSPAAVTVIGHTLWKNHFGADPEVVGRAILLNGQSHLIVGVMPPGFQFLEGQDFQGGTQLWIPLGFDFHRQDYRTRHTLFVVARLAPGSTLAGAQQELDLIAERLERQSPDSNTGWRARAIYLRERLAGDIESALFALLAAVGFVLAIACMTVATLQLARAFSRSGEMAIRTALGATRMRLVRQLLTESAVLSLASGTVGLGLAFLGLPAVVALSPVELIPAFQDIQVDGSVLLFTLGASLATSVLFGLVPALRISGLSFFEGIRSGSRLTRGSNQRHVQNGLVVVQVAVALVLLICAGLLIKSFQRLQEVDLGFATEDLLVARVLFNSRNFPEARDRAGFLHRILERLNAVPGVRSADSMMGIPAGANPITMRFTIEGRPPANASDIDIINIQPISPGLFQTLGVPLIRGRAFTEGDTADTAPVAIISQEMARRYWRDGQDPLGQRVKVGDPASDEPWRTIVGVVGNIHDTGPQGGPGATCYWPFYQENLRATHIVLRTQVDPMSLATPIRKAVLEVDRDQPIYSIATLQERADKDITRQRFSAFLIGLFAFLGLVLAIFGIYGVLSYSVHMRRHEIALRRVMGALAPQVIGLVLKEGLGVAVTGLAIGLAGAFIMTRLLTNLLFGVAPMDLATLAGASILLFLVALSSCLTCAYKAVRIDPIEMLRSE